MKGSIICNYSHGAYLSGDRLQIRQELFRSWLSKQDENVFQELSDDVLRDRGSSDMEGGVLMDIDDFLQSDCIRRRGLFATQLYIWRNSDFNVIPKKIVSLNSGLFGLVRAKTSPQTFFKQPIKVKGKTFFGMVSGFREVLKEWAVLKAAALAVVEESFGAATLSECLTDYELSQKATTFQLGPRDIQPGPVHKS